LEDVEIEMQIFLECKKRNPDESGLLWWGRPGRCS
jgi:hypothetical protein